MLILLPPSEGKWRPQRGAPTRWESLVAADDLTWARHAVGHALAELSAGPDALARLGVGASIRDEVLANLDWWSAPAAPAQRIFTGVLFDALDLSSLVGAPRRRAHSRIRIFSGLHGIVRPTDRIASFRLGADAELLGVGRLRNHWRAHLAPVLDHEARNGLVVDARSGAYRAWWSPPVSACERWLRVDVPGVSHHAKHTRGLVARALCLSLIHI